MNDPVKLVTTKSDVERAAEIKKEIIDSLAPTLVILSKAFGEGFIVQFHCSPNSFNQIVLQSLTLSKQF